MRYCTWRRSQNSSGFYRRVPGKMVEFIRFERNEDGSYNIQKRRGLGGTQEFRTFAKAKNRIIALKKARAYMKKTC